MFMYKRSLYLGSEWDTVFRMYLVRTGATDYESLSFTFTHPPENFQKKRKKEKKEETILTIKFKLITPNLCPPRMPHAIATRTSHIWHRTDRRE